MRGDRRHRIRVARGSRAGLSLWRVQGLSGGTAVPGDVNRRPHERGGAEPVKETRAAFVKRLVREARKGRREFHITTSVHLDGRKIAEVATAHARGERPL